MRNVFPRGNHLAEREYHGNTVILHEACDYFNRAFDWMAEEIEVCAILGRMISKWTERDLFKKSR